MLYLLYIHISIPENMKTLFFLLVIVHLSVLSQVAYTINGKEDISIEARRSPPLLHPEEWTVIDDPNSVAVRAIGVFAVDAHNVSQKKEDHVTFVKNLSARTQRNDEALREFNLLIKGTAHDETQYYRALVTGTTYTANLKLVSFNIEN